MTAPAGPSLPIAADLLATRNSAVQNGTVLPPPTPEFLEKLREASDRLETATPEEIIRWAVATYFPKLTMATAFGPEGCVILYFLSLVEPRTHVFNLDTGYQFKETLDLRDEIKRRYGIDVELKRADTTIEQY